MKEKRWLLFRVVTYLWLVAAIGLLGLLVVSIFTKGNGIQEEKMYTLIAIIILSLQIGYNILNIRLIHHYLFNKQLPPKAFKIWHTVLLIINACMVALLLIALAELISEFYSKPATRHSGSTDTITMLIVSSCILVMLATIVCSVRIRKYIRRYVNFEEEAWLKQLGSEQIQ